MCNNNNETQKQQQKMTQFKEQNDKSGTCINVLCFMI